MSLGSYENINQGNGFDANNNNMLTKGERHGSYFTAFKKPTSGRVGTRNDFMYYVMLLNLMEKKEPCKVF